MPDPLRGFQKVHCIGRNTTGIEVAVEARKVAARYFQTDAVPLAEHIARNAGIHGNLVQLAWHGQ
jgi:hypothetical protein